MCDCEICQGEQPKVERRKRSRCALLIGDEARKVYHIALTESRKYNPMYLPSNQAMYDHIISIVVIDVDDEIKAERNRYTTAGFMNRIPYPEEYKLKVKSSLFAEALADLAQARKEKHP